MCSECAEMEGMCVVVRWSVYVVVKWSVCSGEMECLQW